MNNLCAFLRKKLIGDEELFLGLSEINICKI